MQSMASQLNWDFWVDIGIERGRLVCSVYCISWFALHENQCSFYSMKNCWNCSVRRLLTRSDTQISVLVENQQSVVVWFFKINRSLRTSTVFFETSLEL